MEAKWREFIESIASKMEASDSLGAMLLRETLLQHTPSDTPTMEWAKAYITFQYNCFEFIDYCRKIGKKNEALIVLSLMEAANNALMEETITVPEEFVKEVKF